MTVTANPRRPRSNTAPTSPRGTGTRAAGTPANGATAPRADAASEFANDPFIKRLANPDSAKRDQQSRRHLVDGLKVLEEQRAKATEADAMYDGDLGMVYASSAVRKVLAKQGVNEDDIHDFNYAKIPVDAVADRLQIAAVKVAPTTSEDEEEDGEASADPKTVKRAEKTIKMLRRNNRLDVWEKTLHHNASRHGEAFLFLWPVTDAAGTVVSVDFRVNNAHDVAFVYDPEDPLRPAYVIKSWLTPSEFAEDGAPEQERKVVTRANLYYPGPLTIDGDGQITQGAGRVERWVTNPGALASRPDSWVRVHQMQDTDAEDIDHVAADEFGDVDEPLDKDDMPSPFGLTWFHFRNGVPCGLPEHASAYGPQTMINKLIWSYAGVIEYQGFPQRYIIADPKVDDPLMNLVDPDHPEDDDDDPENLGGTSGLRADPNSVWKLYGKLTGQYSAADPATFMTPLDRFIKSMAELTDVPQYKFTKSSGDIPSGEAVRAIDAPYNAKVADRQARYDPEWQDAYELALRMLAIEGIAVDVRWMPVAAVNDLTGVQVLKAKGDMGVPSEVLLNEMGYPDDQVDAWLKRQEGLSLEQRVALLVQLGTAVQALAAGVTAGVVPDNVTQAFVARIIGNLADGTTDTDPADQVDPLPAPQFRDPPPVLPPGGMLGAGGPGAPGGRLPSGGATSGARRGGGMATGTTRARKAQGSAPARGQRPVAKKAAPAKASVKAAGPAQGG